MFAIDLTIALREWTLLTLIVARDLYRTINLRICWEQYIIIIMVYTGIDPAEYAGNDYVAIWCRYDCSDILRDNMNIHSSYN